MKLLLKRCQAVDKKMDVEFGVENYDLRRGERDLSEGIYGFLKDCVARQKPKC